MRKVPVAQIICDLVGQGTLFKIQIKWACTFLYVICLYTIKVCLSLNRNWFMFPTRKSLIFLLKTVFPDFFFWEHVRNRLIMCIIISYISTFMHIYCSYLHLTLDGSELLMTYLLLIAPHICHWPFSPTAHDE